MGIFLESGKDKAAKEERSAPPFNSCAQDQYSGTINPVPLLLLGYGDSLPFFYFSLKDIKKT